MGPQTAGVRTERSGRGKTSIHVTRRERPRQDQRRVLLARRSAMSGVAAPYRWEQTDAEVVISVPLEPAVKAKDVVWALTPKAELRLGVRGQPPLIDERLWSAVNVDDSQWEVDTVDGQRCLVATLVKTPPGKDWDFLLLSQVRAVPKRSAG